MTAKSTGARCAVLGAALFAMAPVVQASEPADDSSRKIERVVITGSNLKQS
jgi:hypothetical protein